MTHLIQVFEFSFRFSDSHVWRLPVITVRKLLALTVSQVLALVWNHDSLFSILSTFDSVLTYIGRERL